MEIIKLGNTSGLPAYLEAIVERCTTRGRSSFIRAVVLALRDAENLPYEQRTANQTVYESGKRRWCSDFLTNFQTLVRNDLRCENSGAAKLGLSDKDMRAALALACWDALDKGEAIRGVGGNMRSYLGRQRSSRILLECYDQLIDYLKWKSKSRKSMTDKLVKAVSIHDSFKDYAKAFDFSSAEAAIQLRACRQLTDSEHALVMSSFTPQGVTTGRAPRVNPAISAPYGDKDKVEFQPGNIVVRKANTVGLNDAFMKAGNFYTVAEVGEESIKLLGSTLWYGTRYFDISVLHSQPTPKPDSLQPCAPQVQLSTLGDSNMFNDTPSANVYASSSVATIRSFNFTKPAIVDIKHVYGVPVSEIDLKGITSALTNRQQEVDRLKAIPHKPAVIKKQIADLKQEIADLLELANELFPVAE